MSGISFRDSKKKVFSKFYSHEKMSPRKVTHKIYLVIFRHFVNIILIKNNEQQNKLFFVSKNPTIINLIPFNITSAQKTIRPRKKTYQKAVETFVENS